MATLYGSAVASTGGNTRQSTRSFAHARVRQTYSTLDGTPTTSDVIVLGLLKSDCLLKDIGVMTDGVATAGAINVGLSSVELANNSLALTTVDADLFASAFSMVTAIGYTNRTSLFAESTTLDEIMDRGKMLWELAALGAASYTSDPGLTFAITVTPSTTFDAAMEIGFTIEYVAGD